MKIQNKLLLGVVWLAFIAVVMAGCGQGVTPSSPQSPSGEVPQGGNEELTAEIVALYFSEAEANGLIKEEREVSVDGKDLKVLVLEELLKGPRSAELNPTIPQGVKVLSVVLEDGIAVVNFSEELRSKHSGGSTGELLTVYSIVNTLTDLPGVEKVKFLVEGEELETLAGHMGLLEPVEPDWSMVLD